MMKLSETDDPALFGDLETYCMFLGYPRSGHSLIGALLDAHPNIIMAHELDALQFVAAGLDRSQICSLLLKNSRAAKEAGRQWGDYRYEVPGQWQGRFEKLRVIGDKKGGGSLRRLCTDLQLLRRLRETMSLPVKLIHVVRNPYDNISSMARHRGGRTLPLENCIESYFTRCETFARVQREIADGDIRQMRYESFLNDPRGGLEGLCSFLGVAAQPDYLTACAGIVFDSPHQSRAKVPWTEYSVEVVREKMRAYPFLADYTFAA